MADNETLLSIEKLSSYFFTETGVAKAVQDVSFEVRSGKTFALVGESGCGKTVMALAIMRLVPEPQGRIVGGKITFEGRGLLEPSEKQMREVRGNKIAMIFQEPMTSLNPVYTVGSQIVEAIRVYKKKEVSEAWEDAVELLRKTGMTDPQQRAMEYPHQMSGGMRQRAMIAMAISCGPKLLIADESVSSLDVSIQSQILNLLKDLQEEFGLTYLFIAHNLAVVEFFCDVVAVMYMGRIVERAKAEQFYRNPLHPYTRALMSAIPQVEPSLRGKRAVLSGEVPSVLNPPAGCAFHPRCPLAEGDCLKQMPPLEGNEEHIVACWKAEQFKREEDKKS